MYCQANTEPEGFGLSFIEAMRAGLPVVTSGIGGACEIVNDVCGTLVEAGDVYALSQALRRFVCDPALSGTFAKGATQRAAALCDPTQQMRRIQVLLSRAAAQRPRVGRAHAVNVK